MDFNSFHLISLRASFFSYHFASLVSRHMVPHCPERRPVALQVEGAQAAEDERRRVREDGVGELALHTWAIGILFEKIHIVTTGRYATSNKRHCY